MSSAPYIIRSKHGPPAKTVNEEHLKLLECPICYHPMSPPLTTCKNGHGICKSCRTRVTTCVICKTEFTSNQNTLLNQIMESMIVPCRYKNNGCKYCTSQVTMSTHEKSCSLRSMYCCICNEKTSLIRLGQHFESHKIPETYNNLSFSQSFNVIFRFEKDGNSCILLKIPSARCYFLIRYKTDLKERSISVCVQYVGKTYSQESYIFSLKIDQNLSRNNPCYFTSNCICSPYVYEFEKTEKVSKMVKLDLESIFFDDQYISKKGFAAQIEIRLA